MGENLSRGVIVFNIGKKCIPRMIVFLRSLRKHYKGNVTVFLEGEHDATLVKDIQNTFNVDVVYRPDNKSASRALLRKTEVCLDSPYDLSVLIDTDTIVLGDFSELFEEAKNYDLVIPHFAGWSSSGSIISRRIKGYLPLKPQYVEDAIKYGPAINTGVFAWRKGSPIFKEWIEIAKWGDEVGHLFIYDEVACQLLLPRYNCKIVDKKYNVSVLHDPSTEDPRIVHFHGKKHCIEEEKCKIWMREFIEALKENTCNIKKYSSDGCEDKRLNKFIRSNNPTMHFELRSEMKKLIGLSSHSICPGFNDDEVTVVTACDPKYIEHLKVTLPNWIKHKHIDKFPMLVYVNGFRKPHKNSELDFLRKAIPNLRIIPWDMPEAESQREKMLTAFVLGAAKDVTTPYWVKIDADAFATDDEPLLIPEMKKFVICGHKWGYSFTKHMEPLISWANSNVAFKNTPPDFFDPNKVDGRRYNHDRVASYVQFHQSEFVRQAAAIAGNRLPVPSHDTYLWYVANRLGYPIMRHNFKRHRGMSNKSEIESLKQIVSEIDPEFSLNK